MWLIGRLPLWANSANTSSVDFELSLACAATIARSHTKPRRTKTKRRNDLLVLDRLTADMSMFSVAINSPEIGSPTTTTTLNRNFPFLI